MVNVQPTNEKLIQRATNIIKEAAEIEESQAKEYLEASTARSGTSHCNGESPR